MNTEELLIEILTELRQIRKLLSTPEEVPASTQEQWVQPSEIWYSDFVSKWRVFCVEEKIYGGIESRVTRAAMDNIYNKGQIPRLVPSFETWLQLVKDARVPTWAELGLGDRSQKTIRDILLQRG